MSDPGEIWHAYRQRLGHFSCGATLQLTCASLICGAKFENWATLANRPVLTAASKFQNAIKAANSSFNSTKHIQKLALEPSPFSRDAGPKFAPFLRVSGHKWPKMASL